MREKTLGAVIAHFGEGHGTPLQHSCLENPMDGGAWWAAVHGVAKGWTRPSDFTFTLHFHAMEKEMATHSSVLAWRITGTAEPGGLPTIGSHRVGPDRSDLAAAAAAEPISPNLCVQQQGYGEGTVKYFEYFQYCCSDGLLTLVKCKSCFHV